MLPGAIGRALAALAGTAALACWAVTPLAPDSARRATVLWGTSILLWGAAWGPRWNRPKLGPAFAGALLAWAVSALPRLLYLTTSPYSLPLDEVISAHYGLEALRKHPWEIPHGASWYFATPYWTHALQAWPCLLLEPVLGARLASAVLGLGSLGATYFLGRQILGSLGALVALVCLGTSYWHVVYSRLGYPFIQAMLFVPFSLWVSMAGVRGNSNSVAFAGGALFGASALAYTPSRIAPLLFVLWFVHYAVARRLPRRQAAAHAVAVTMGLLLAVAPFVRAHGPGAFFGRLADASVRSPRSPVRVLSQQGWTLGAVRRVLGAQAGTALRVYWSPGGVFAPSDFAPGPLVDPVFLGLALSGLAIAAASPKNSDRFLLAAWVAVPVVLGQILTDVPAAAYRAAPALPALALCAGLFAAKVLPAGAVATPARSASLGLVGTALLLPLNLFYLRAFMAGRRDAPQAAMARLIGRGDLETVYYLVSSEPFAGHELIRFLAAGREVRDVPNLLDTLYGEDLDRARDAMFVLGPGFHAAAEVIARCYPAASLVLPPAQESRRPVVGVFVPKVAFQSAPCSPDGFPNRGWRARYFAGREWNGGIVLERMEDWMWRWRPANRREPHGSVEWTGGLKVPAAGHFRLALLSPAAVGFARIGDAVAIEGGKVVEADLGAGVYPVTVRCRAEAARGGCLLLWAPPGGELSVIPPEFMTPPGS